MSAPRGLSPLIAPKKQQQSISSFFTSSSTPKTSKAASLPLVTPGPTLSYSNSETTADDHLYQDNGTHPSLRSETGPSERLPTLKRQRDQDNEGDVKRRRISFEDGSKEPAVVAARQRSNGSTSQISRLVAQPSQRTSKYLFGSIETEEEDQDEEVIRQKEVLHQRFVKKLGRPDSLAEIRRKNHVLVDSVPDDEENDNEESEDGDGRKTTANGKRIPLKKVTPMVKQMLDIKRKNLDTLIVMEVGYKFKFYGEDARTAAKELSIVCIPGKYRFDDHPSEAHYDYYASASIPVHRLHVHVRRLVAAGHKVGIVRQLETAALKKVGDNRNTPFVRELTNLYTKGTYIDDVEALDTTVGGPSGGAPATGHLLCITETNAKGWGTDEKVDVAIVAVQPATGEIIYDDFEDGFMRSEIETRLLHIAPCEFLIVGQLSTASERLIQHLSSSKANVFGDKARVERVERPKTMAAHAFSHISKFYAEKLACSESVDELQSRGTIDKVHKLSEQVTICLSAMITHLAEYGLQNVFDLTKNFQSFSARSHMLLNGNTLSSLEIYRNQTDNTEKGSLLWVLDRTQTRFGQRLLRKWVGRPLLEIARLQERVAAVEELLSCAGTLVVENIRTILIKMKVDLEKSLIRVYYKKCTRPELVNMLQTLQKAASAFPHVQNPADAGFKSKIINEAIAALPRILEDVVAYLDQINLQAAKDDDKYEFFRNEHETDKVTHHKVGIASMEYELDEYRKIAAERLKKKKVEYVTWNKLDFLIEVDNTQLKHVPASWAKISGTKKLSRFHTPEVIKMIRERDQHKEALAAACDEAFHALLTSMSTKYQALRDCIQSLATLDCLLSLADVAAQPGYVKADLTNETGISVVGGRHPMVEQLLLDSYVPNNIELSASGIRSLLITGPNMGGKSSYVRQVALIAIMGQIGSYVPAASARLGMLDAIFTRMGAFDNIMSGKSTFMVELSETADILKQATPRSLVILDELGRGTSTHDGVAIAEAVLQHIVHETKSLLLFITHYQSLAKVSGGIGDGSLRNMHMRFTEGTTNNSDGGGQDITFLYELGLGVAHRSYGLNVAKLASVPQTVLDVAAIKSKELEVNVQTAKLKSLLRVLGKLSSPVDAVQAADIVVTRLQALVEGIEQL